MTDSAATPATHWACASGAKALRAALHEAILAAKIQVLAQYGDDSPALHAIGRKRKSERSRPARKVTPAA